ncbi:DUF6166 domain-containing protein [Candidatus Methylacidiphilum infernorum]|uniref:Uncharacterized protein n=1 Tax=Methylacidiphilum infernorum (isolate V4) TaxID=481448 RepID=B3DW99_METI4|nr:DUF6166 domain-containing protein [Candidatus Methylacidiphilum infernorum]ACD83602.1 Hypothetical protein Minf_1548 [Methylacidiphilum infernorum V4]
MGVKKYVGVYEGDHWPRVYIVEENGRWIPLDKGWPVHEWGFRGPGPQQLARDLVIDIGLKDEEFDAVLDIVSRLQSGFGWELTEQQIKELVQIWHAIRSRSNT